MGCNCLKRREAIGRAVTAVAQGDLKTVADSAAYVASTLAQDVRSGALKQAAAINLARLIKR